MGEVIDLYLNLLHRRSPQPMMMSWRIRYLDSWAIQLTQFFRFHFPKLNFLWNMRSFASLNLIQRSPDGPLRVRRWGAKNSLKNVCKWASWWQNAMPCCGYGQMHRNKSFFFLGNTHSWRVEGCWAWAICVIITSSKYLFFREIYCDREDDRFCH